MKSRWTFRCYPTPEQEDHLNRTFGCVRFVWNWALRARTDAFRAGERMGYPATDKALTALKATPEHIWLNEVSSVCLQQALRDLQVAFSNFFDKRTAYPAFKRKDARQSANYTERGFSFNAATRTLKLAKIGAIKVKWSRKAIPHHSSIRLIRTASGKYFISMVVETQAVALPETGQAVGIDLGLTHLATLSTGEKIENPRHLANRLRYLRQQQRCLSRRAKGSKRREKQRLRVARAHRKVADCRSYELHKLTTRLVREFDVIAIEDLAVKNMIQHPRLARAIADAGWGEVRRQLEYKCAWYGRTLAVVDRWLPSSKTCSACGHKLEKLALSVRGWTCPDCGADHDRDHNASQVIVAAGMRQLGPGEPGDLRVEGPRGPNETRTGRMANECTTHE